VTEPAHLPAVAGPAPAADSGSPAIAAAGGRAPDADRHERRSWLPLLGSAVLAAALLGLLLIAKYAT
jgi:hypothetical protein